MEVSKADTAVVFIDPQNDVLSEKGANWGALGASVTENHTVDNMAKIFQAAKANDYQVFISPHYFFPTDYAGGNSMALSNLMSFAPTLSPEQVHWI
jgi:nicotinamidase-related amidase